MAQGGANRVRAACLLLKDTVGEKSGYWKREIPVLKGTLIMTLSKDVQLTASGKPAHNFSVYKENITLFCAVVDVAPLTDYEFQLLQGISKPGARFDAFIGDTLDWGSKLRVGNTVNVSQEAIAINTKGLIKWIGTLKSEEGIKFGIEITEGKYRGSGVTNGVFQGQQLFVCDENCGLFVSLDKLAPTPNIRPVNSEASNSTTFKKSLMSIVKNITTGHTMDTKPVPGTHSTQTKSVFRFKNGDRVVCHNKDQILIHGTVRWTGDANTDDGKLKVVGIETDVSVQKDDFFVTITGLHANFKCINPWVGKIVLPEELVQTEVEALALQQKNRADHDKLHLRHEDRLIIPDALSKAEQERLIRECNQERDEKRRHQRQKYFGSVNINESYSPLPAFTSCTSSDAPSFSHPVLQHRDLTQDKQLPVTQHDSRSEGTPKPKNHINDTVKLGHHSGSGRNIARQNSQSTIDVSIDPHTYSYILPGPGNGASTTIRATAHAPCDGQPRYQFVMGSRVQFGDPPRYGEIRWMGNVPQVEVLITGVELDEPMDGCTDGTWQEQRYFRCRYRKGFFCPVTILKPQASFPDNSTPPLYRGSNQPPTPEGGPVNNARDTRPPPQGPTDNLSREPRQHHPQGVADNQHWESRLNVQGPAAPNITVDSPVQIGDPRNPWYGMVKWIGHLPGSRELMAGIELEEYGASDRCGDGEWFGTRYFKCDYGKAFFCPVTHIQGDSRFVDLAPSRGLSDCGDNPLQVPYEERDDQGVPYSTEFYIGSKKGIQGNQNSCYLDSSLFGLFALSDIFDEMFLAVAHDRTGTTDLSRRTVSDMLWRGIVNPLRKNGVVRFESVMRIRNKLDELGKMEGVTETKKDPDMFLNMLFKHVLRVTPFISLKRPFGVEQEFFVQLFVEHDPNLRLPTVGDLLHRMFREQNISFTEIPSKFLLQVPRFGREFKAYNKIIPDLKLNISEITDSGKTPPCMSCGEPSVQKCFVCEEDFPRQSVNNYVYFCATCSALAHKKEERKLHKLESALDNDTDLYKLDLLSVICIETSHYVCFTRDLNSNTWLFFDSMADRVHDKYNIPRVTDCTRELNEWVYQGGKDRLVNTPPRELPELVRRFTQDIYMCVYVQPDIAMYGPDDSLSFSVISSASQAEGTKNETKYVQLLARSPNMSAQNSMEDKKELESKLVLLRKELQEKKKSFACELEMKSKELEVKSQELESKSQELEVKSQELEVKSQELEVKSRELVIKSRDLAAAQRCLEESEQRAADAEMEKYELSSRLSKELKSTKKELEGKTKELAAHNTEAWKIPAKKLTTHRKIGTGGWGKVLEGTVRVAVKKLHEAIVSPKHIEKMEREMKLLAEVRHPNLVQFVGAVFDDQNQGNQRTPPRIVTELLDMNLRQAYERNKLAPGNRLSIFKDVARALDYLHQRYEPIIHRDVSAPNILLQEMPNHQWKGKVSDLGSANFLQHAHTAGEGAIVYSPPEVIPQPFSKPLPQTVKIDVYSYGILLCEVTTSQFPSGENYPEMIQQIQRDYPTLYELINRCIKRDPSDRPSMAEVLVELNKMTSF